MHGLGERLRQRARELGLSDTEVARRLGLSQARYAHYVNDKREPDFQTFVNICRILSTSPNHLLGFGEAQHPSGLAETAAPFDAPGGSADAVLLRHRIAAAAEAMPALTLRTAATVMDALVRMPAED